MIFVLLFFLTYLVLRTGESCISTHTAGIRSTGIPGAASLQYTELTGDGDSVGAVWNTVHQISLWIIRNLPIPAAFRMNRCEKTDTSNSDVRRLNVSNHKTISQTKSQIINVRSVWSVKIRRRHAKKNAQKFSEKKISCHIYMPRNATRSKRHRCRCGTVEICRKVSPLATHTASCGHSFPNRHSEGRVVHVRPLPQSRFWNGDTRRTSYWFCKRLPLSWCPI